MDAPTEIGMAMPPEVVAVQAEDQRRLASLASLSLNKDGQTGPVTMSTAAPPRSSKLPWILLALVCVGGGIYMVKGRGSTATATDAKPSTAAVAPIAPTRTGDLIASGYIAAKAPITLAASPGSRVAELKVDNGDRVTKDQIVATIADGPLRAEYALANARLRDAQRSHNRTRASFRAEGATAQDVERAFGAVEIAAAEVRVIKQKLEETKIRSPVDGTVLEILARPGEALAVGTDGAAGVMRLADLSQLVAEADISEAELKTIVIGQHVEVTTEAQRDKTYKAKVREISQQADRSRGTVLVRAYIDEPAKGESVLKPGMAVQVRFLREEPKEEPTDGPDQGSADTKAPAASTTADKASAKTELPAADKDSDGEPEVEKPVAAKPKPKAKPRPKARPRTKPKKKGSGVLDI